MVEIFFLGNSAVGITSGEASILVDPFLSENDECPWSIEETVENIRPDAVCVTHAAFDHLGDTLVLASEYSLPVITEPATAHFLRSKGVNGDQITVLVWGMEAGIGGMDIRALEARHISTTVVDGTPVTGLPLSFLVQTESRTVYHMGDTSIFSDLELFGELYEPDVVMLGVGQAYDRNSASAGPIRETIHELTISEATVVAKWLDGEWIIPMHYLPDERDAFIESMEAESEAPTVLPLDPGESFQLE